MRQGNRLVAAAITVLLVAGCHAAQDASLLEMGAAAPPVTAANLESSASEEASFLAYEHDASITLPAEQIQTRLQQAQEACRTAKFGQCVVLNVRQQGGDWPSASLGMRLAPAGVEPMIALASADAELGSRSTRAEDLAVVVRDNTLAQDRLRKERERLQEFQGRRDLAVADMIALSKQLAETEAQLEAAEQQGAQHRRRIDTQLLTLEFRPTASQVNRNEVWLALRDSGETLSSGVAWTIRAIAFLLPVVAVLVVFVALVRRWRRRRKGA